MKVLTSTGAQHKDNDNQYAPNEYHPLKSSRLVICSSNGTENKYKRSNNSENVMRMDVIQRDLQLMT